MQGSGYTIGFLTLAVMNLQKEPHNHLLCVGGLSPHAHYSKLSEGFQFCNFHTPHFYTVHNKISCVKATTQDTEN